jgi:hypothetical protein
VKQVYSYTGYRYLMRARRVRWREVSTLRIEGVSRRRMNAILTKGTATPAEWLALAQRLDVDIVVGDERAATTPPFQSQQAVWGTFDGRRYAVIRVGTCGRG